MAFTPATGHVNWVFIVYFVQLFLHKYIVYVSIQDYDATRKCGSMIHNANVSDKQKKKKKVHRKVHDKLNSKNNVL